MGIKKTALLLTFIVLCGGLFLSPTKVFAASGSIGISPRVGTYHTGDTFTVNVNANGGGTPFNVATANVIVAPSLKILSVTMGDCGFAFVKVPTQMDPSFVGVMLGDSATSCTIYTLSLQANQSGVGSIVFLNSSLKAYKGASELLSSTNNGAYTITGNNIQNQTPAAPTQPPLVGRNGTQLYTLQVYITPPSTVPLSSLKVILDPNLPSEKVVSSFTPESIKKPVVFEQVPQGVHVVETFSDNTPIYKQIATVSGPDRTLVFSISSQRTEIPWIMVILTGAIIIALCFVSVMIYKMWKKLRKSSSANTTDSSSNPPTASRLMSETKY